MSENICRNRVRSSRDNFSPTPGAGSYNVGPRPRRKLLSAGAARWAGLVLAPRPGARASPIDYSKLTDTQLQLGFLVGVLVALIVGAMGVVGLVRHWRAYRRTGEGMDPKIIVGVVGGLIVAILLATAVRLW